MNNRYELIYLATKLEYCAGVPARRIVDYARQNGLQATVTRYGVSEEDLCRFIAIARY